MRPRPHPAGGEVGGCWWSSRPDSLLLRRRWGGLAQTRGPLPLDPGLSILGSGPEPPPLPGGSTTNSHFDFLEGLLGAFLC